MNIRIWKCGKLNKIIIIFWGDSNLYGCFINKLPYMFMSWLLNYSINITFQLIWPKRPCELLSSRGVCCCRHLSLALLTKWNMVPCQKMWLLFLKIQHNNTLRHIRPFGLKRSLFPDNFNINFNKYFNIFHFTNFRVIVLFFWAFFYLLFRKWKQFDD